MNIITLNTLSKAIENRIGDNDYSSENAYRDANFVLDLFGYDDRIIDNTLDPEDRQLFYILEEEGMLESEREETILYNGRNWITHYWKFKKASIIRYSFEPKPKVQKTENAEKNIYDTLSDEMWHRIPKPII